ncbi:MAG: hypothetical protein GQ540_11805 [Lutibacter sp.]|uniref:transporter n=1 Tax=Lutibacter sp. TaxID=1925666 RepID=UPI0019ED5CCA|nr:transporter [Lutibacter sp.]NOR29201.1 hypothetical protein [Lutibacter sp.]
MITTKKIVTLVTLFISTWFNAQEIVTDRPDQTESSITVEKGALQIESGVNFENSNNHAIKSIVGPSTLVRYGISNGIELRFVSQYESTKIELIGSSVDYSGFNDLEIGTKVQLFKKENKNIEIAFLSHLILPTAKTNLTTSNFGVINKLAISHVISNKIGLGYNIGYDLIEKQSALTYSLAFGIALSETIGFYIEPYGSWGESNIFENNFDIGFTYLLNNNFQLDVSYGKGLNNDMEYVSAGFSWKIPKFLTKK